MSPVNPPSQKTPMGLGTRWTYWRRFYLPNLVYLGILVAVMLASYWWVRHDSAPKVAAPPKDKTLQDGYAQQVELTQTARNGQLMYHAVMTQIEHFGTQDLKGRDMVLTARPVGQPEVVVRAQNALWLNEARVVELSGQIELTRGAQTVATSDEASPAMTVSAHTLRLELDKGLASTPDAFTLTHGHSRVTGQGFVYDYQTRDLRMGTQDALKDTTTSTRVRARVAAIDVPR